MATKFDRAIPQIRTHFESLSGLILTTKSIQQLFWQKRDEWGLAQSTTANEFIDLITSRLGLRRFQLKSENHPTTITRYVWGATFSPHLLALSLRPNSYLSHGTAVFLRGLNQQISKTIYVNSEQTPKPLRMLPLAQDRIQLAFSRAQRISTFVFALEGYRIVLLSGKHTGRLEVGEIVGPLGESLPITKVERTLIDIVVRPAYAGGILQILEAYRAARESLSVNVLVATLRKLSYIYPYHQAIGFLMERAGYPDNRLDLLRSLGLNFDFYLTHNMKSPDYDPKWKLFYPKGL